VLDGVRNATLPGDLTYIDNLSLFIHHRSQSVSIRIDTDYVYVSVEGEDPGWVRGRIGGLHDLLADTSVKWAPRADMQFVLFFAGWIIGSLSGLLYAFTIKDDADVILAWIATTIFGTSLGFLLGRWIDRRKRTELRLAELPSTRQKDWVAIGVLIATIATLIATIVAIVVAHSDVTNSRHAAPATYVPRPCQSTRQAKVLSGHSPVQIYRATCATAGQRSAERT
jgi:hypothetical protein